MTPEVERGNEHQMILMHVCRIVPEIRQEDNVLAPRPFGRGPGVRPVIINIVGSTSSFTIIDKEFGL